MTVRTVTVSAPSTTWAAVSAVPEDEIMTVEPMLSPLVTASTAFWASAVPSGRAGGFVAHSCSWMFGSKMAATASSACAGDDEAASKDAAEIKMDETMGAPVDSGR